MPKALPEKPLVSIIIPCWNAERLVGDAIRSALQQTYPSKEIVVIDDGSSDGSLGVIRSFGDRVRWATGPNRGGGAARNRGLLMSRGDLIQFLDADDVLKTTKLEQQVPLLDLHPGASIHSDIEVMDVDSKAVSVKSSVEEDDFLRCCFENIPTPAPLHRKESLLRVSGFDESLDCAQEFDLHLRMVCAGVRFVRIAQPLVTVRRHPGSVSSDYARVLSRFGHIVSGALATLERFDRDGERERRILSEVLALAAVRLLERDRVENASECFALASRTHPSAGTGVLTPLRRMKFRALGIKQSHPLLTACATGRRWIRSRTISLRRLRATTP